MRSINDEIAKNLKDILPDTFRILSKSHLMIHDVVCSVILSGSRGLKGGFRPDSDIDLSLLVDSSIIASVENNNSLFSDVLAITLQNWTLSYELDIAVIFDKNNCLLSCFKFRNFNDLGCDKVKQDCFGIYKTQKGFHGIVPNIGLQIKDIYPLLVIWDRTWHD